MVQHIEKRSKGINEQLTKTGVLLALALCFQIGLFPLAQPAVGPLVNMTLLVATFVIGPIPAVVIGSITPLMAFMLGIMPLPVLLPVVMLGNTTFIVAFYLLSTKIPKKYQVVPLLVSAFAKYVIMATMIRFIGQFVMPGMPVTMIQAFSLPQFYTAIVGGIIALTIMRYLPKSMITNEPK